MATILEAPLNKSKAKWHAAKVDMTPMVDLGFLLITFFIFTTTLMQPAITKLVMPKESKVPMDVSEKTLLTVLVDRDRVIVYDGELNKAITANKLVQTNYDVQTGLGHLIRQKQKNLGSLNQKEELMVAIKPLPSASYQDVINALDEMLINNVSRYGIMNVSEEEKQLIASHGKQRQ